MSWVDMVGYAAALAVLGSFCMSTIVPLRVLAIVSNVLFGAYGILAHLYPVFLLHSILLPINLVKLAQLQVFDLARHGRLLQMRGDSDFWDHRTHEAAGPGGRSGKPLADCAWPSRR
jgi:hypothetical protein